MKRNLREINMLYKYFVLLLAFLPNISMSQIYPDQDYVLRIDSIFQNIETNEGLKLSDDGKSILLQRNLSIDLRQIFL